MQYYVYILSNKKYGTLYTGITSDLVGRVYQHKKRSLFMASIVKGCVIRTLVPVRFGNGDFLDATVPRDTTGIVRRVCPSTGFIGKRFLVRFEVSGKKTITWVFPSEVKEVSNDGSIFLGANLELNRVESILWD